MSKTSDDSLLAYGGGKALEVDVGRYHRLRSAYHPQAAAAEAQPSCRVAGPISV